MKTLRIKERIKLADIQFQKENSDSVHDVDYKEHYIHQSLSNNLSHEETHAKLDNMDIPRKIEHDVWNALMIEINPSLKVLTLNQRFAIKNGLIEKEMHEWEKQCSSGLWMVQEFRTYRYINKNWFGNKASDEQIHQSLDSDDDIPRLMTEEEWNNAPKKFLENT